MDLAFAYLLDESKPFDVSLLDQIMAIAMDAKHDMRGNANEFLVKLQDRGDMWKRVDSIVETSTSVATKVFGLQILQIMINTRWQIIQEEQREGVRNYILGKIIMYCTDIRIKRENGLLLSKLDTVLVAIVKHEWPRNWPNFIDEIVETSRQSEAMCENNMQVLKLLSEEIFEGSKGILKSSRISELQDSLTRDFVKIYQLCEAILGEAVSSTLMEMTLTTLRGYLVWIPLEFCYETSLIPALVNTFLPVPAYRTLALDCLTEIASISLEMIPPEYHNSIPATLNLVLTRLRGICLPKDIATTFDINDFENQSFIKGLAQYFTTFLRNYQSLLEENNLPDIHFALEYVLAISQLNDDDIFDYCIEYWSYFCQEIYYRSKQLRESNVFLFGNPLAIFDDISHALRMVLVDVMAKPEQVLVVEEDGQIIREVRSDSEQLSLYKLMREGLIYLTHLSPSDMKRVLLAKLEQYRDAAISHGKWSQFNSVCWSIGSISGAMTESDEEKFMLEVTNILLAFNEQVTGKSNKAIIASNIMFIYGQYARYLRSHWNILKTVVYKLFEFMHEHYEGIQNMACDTFTKITTRCKRKFVIKQPNETHTFVEEILEYLPMHISDLLPHQVLSFYRSMGTLLSYCGPYISITRSKVMLQLMKIEYNKWLSIIHQSPEFLIDCNVANTLTTALRIHTAVCSTSGPVFGIQFGQIVEQSTHMFNLYSNAMTEIYSKESDRILNLDWYKAMRAYNSEYLRLMTTYCNSLLSWSVEEDSPPKIDLRQYFPTILFHYRNAAPQNRNPLVLKFFRTWITLFKEQSRPYILEILDATFEPTLALISTNMVEYPEHRSQFFGFLLDLTRVCSFDFFLGSHHHGKIVDAMLWAVRHTDRDISDTGFEILETILENMESGTSDYQDTSDGNYNNATTYFYRKYITSIIHEVFTVLTDRLHKSGFGSHCRVLKIIFFAVADNEITGPIFHMGCYDSNAHFLREFTANLLMSEFPNIAPSAITNFVSGLFDVNKDVQTFKTEVRDFLVATKEFSLEDNSDLFLEEKEAEFEVQMRKLKALHLSTPGLDSDHDT